MKSSKALWTNSIVELKLTHCQILSKEKFTVSEAELLDFKLMKF